MNLLLDTHSFLWYYKGVSDLSIDALQLIESPENDFFISTVSLWEIAIKNSLGKLELEGSLGLFFKDVVQKGFNLLPIELSHIVQSAALPFHHRDPFDRLLIGQAIAEKMPIVTKDIFFEPYCLSDDLQLIW